MPAEAATLGPGLLKTGSLSHSQMPAFVLHIGLSKTGTTTLQHGLSRHAGVHYLGKSSDYGGPEGSRSREVFGSLNEVLWRKPLPEEASQPAVQPLGMILQSPTAAGRVTVASWEGLGSRPTAFFAGMLARLQAACPQVHLLCCLRDPASWLVSTYLQHLRGQFLKRSRDTIFDGRPWLPLGDWLERSATGDLHGLVWQRANIRAALEALGPEQVGVFSFEQLKAQPEAYYRGVSAFVGIDADEMLRHLKTEHRNPRLSQAACDFMQHVAETPTLCTAWRNQSPAERRTSLRSATARTPSAASVSLSLPVAWQQRVHDLLAIDTAWINATLGSPPGDATRSAG